MPDDAWYAPAVNAMEGSGILNGTSGGFDPLGQVSFAQLCQALAKACELPAGKLNGHWAGQAIQSCLDAGSSSLCRTTSTTSRSSAT